MDCRFDNDGPKCYGNYVDVEEASAKEGKGFVERLVDENQEPKDCAGSHEEFQEFARLTRDFLPPLPQKQADLRLVQSTGTRFCKGRRNGVAHFLIVLASWQPKGLTAHYLALACELKVAGVCGGDVWGKKGPRPRYAPNLNLSKTLLGAAATHKPWREARLQREKKNSCLATAPRGREAIER